MTTKEINPNIDFCDSCYESCQMEEGNLTIKLRSWDDKKITITFFTVIGFIYKTGSVVSGAYETTASNYFFTEILSLYYEKPPNENQFKLFYIKDIEDVNLFEIIAQNASVFKD